MANSEYAKVVLDSIGPNGKRLISVEAKYWRAIHAELMTHRDRARNAASSRAIPFYRESKEEKTADEIRRIGGLVLGKAISLDPNETYRYVIPKCTYSMITNDPFIPEFIGSEQVGMQSGSELIGLDRDSVEQSIDRMRHFCLAEGKSMYDRGCHKSIINRYVEPWSYITTLYTATEWKNFFRLRVHPKAEKHFNKIATMIRDAIYASTPQVLRAGEWHTPYLQPDDGLEPSRIIEMTDRELFEAMPLVTARCKRISAGRCARVSYLTQDGVRDQGKDIDLFEGLIHPKIDAERDDDVIHASALEHVAQAQVEACRSGPFDGWLQFRKEFPNENVPG